MATEYREAREKLGLSQEALAEKIGTTQQTVDRIEKGKVHHSRFIAPLRRELGIDMPEASDGASNADRPTLPVYAAVEGGPGEMVVSTDPIEHVRRPWFMKGKEGYAVLVVGESMEPEFEPGDMVIVNPRLPAVRNKAAIFVSSEHVGEFRATLKRLVRMTEREWVVKQFNPARELKLSRERWPKALRVVGKYAGG